jgi:hypothetical protein
MRKGVWGLALLAVFAFGVLTIKSQTTHKKTGSTKGHATSSTVSADIRAAAHDAAASGCDDSLWQHVYHPTRLKVIEKCIQVTGTIHHIKREADGDDHIQIMVDPPFDKLLNDKNRSAQAGALVVEPVCEGPVTQSDAVAACKDFHSPVRLPKDGTQVTILGSFVLDTEAAHGWTEIHPVTSITK